MSSNFYVTSELRQVAEDLSFRKLGDSPYTRPVWTRYLFSYFLCGLLGYYGPVYHRRLRSIERRSNLERTEQYLHALDSSELVPHLSETDYNSYLALIYLRQYLVNPTWLNAKETIERFVSLGNPIGDLVGILVATARESSKVVGSWLVNHSVEEFLRHPWCIPWQFDIIRKARLWSDFDVTSQNVLKLTEYSWVFLVAQAIRFNAVNNTSEGRLYGQRAYKAGGRSLALREIAYGNLSLSRLLGAKQVPLVYADARLLYRQTDEFLAGS